MRSRLKSLGMERISVERRASGAGKSTIPATLLDAKTVGLFEKILEAEPVARVGLQSGSRFRQSSGDCSTNLYRRACLGFHFVRLRLPTKTAAAIDRDDLSGDIALRRTRSKAITRATSSTVPMHRMCIGILRENRQSPRCTCNQNRLRIHNRLLRSRMFALTFRESDGLSSACSGVGSSAIFSGMTHVSTCFATEVSSPCWFRTSTQAIVRGRCAVPRTIARYRQRRHDWLGSHQTGRRKARHPFQTRFS
jgi:hypothetical protein